MTKPIRVHRENSHRMHKSFHLLLKSCRVTEVQPLFPMIPHSAGRLAARNATMVLRSQGCFPLFQGGGGVSLKHFGESGSTDQRREREESQLRRESQVLKQDVTQRKGMVRSRELRQKTSCQVALRRASTPVKTLRGGTRLGCVMNPPGESPYPKGLSHLWAFKLILS